MGKELIKAFEKISDWREKSSFEAEHEGYITIERMGDATAMFFWRVDFEPVPLAHMFLDGITFVKFTNNNIK